MKTMWDVSAGNRAKIHAINEDGTIVCTNKRPAHPLCWEEFETLEDLCKLRSPFHCRRCAAILNKESGNA